MRDKEKASLLRWIGYRVSYFRKRQHMTQKELAEKIHRADSVVSRIERGRYNTDLSLSLLLDLAHALNIRLFILFIPEDEPAFQNEEENQWETEPLSQRKP